MIKNIVWRYIFMINTQYENLISPMTTGQNVKKSAEAKAEPVNMDDADLAVNPNRDTFEHITTETAVTYSPETIGKNASVNSITSTTTRATTTSERRLIPKLLAAKMAGVRTYYDGSPIINGPDDAKAYQTAQNKIHGDHAELYVKNEYRYSQTGYDYGNPEPEISCCTFAFATALSIKYNTKITPDKIETVPGRGYVDNNTSGTEIWQTKDGKYKAYKIIGSSGSETLAGIDAQLQLGNPVLIHTSGKSVSSASSEHWATVIGKQNGKYTIIDPWDGTKRSLDDMEIYKNGGSILEYTILSDEY